MIFNEEVMDILEVPNKYFIAHATSADLDMSTGLAKIIDNSYDLKAGLERAYEDYVDYMMNDDYDEVKEDGEVLMYGKIFTLLVKPHSYDKVNIETVKKCMYILKDMVINEGVRHLAFPTICCGNMGLKWKDVKSIIKSCFYDTDIDILICHTDKKYIVPTKEDILDTISNEVDDDCSDEKLQKLYELVTTFLDNAGGDDNWQM